MSLLWPLVVLTLLGLSTAQSDEEKRGQEFVENYNVVAEAELYENILASWEYSTNITPKNQATVVAANLKFSQFQEEMMRNASTFDSEKFQNETLKRLFRKIRDVGTAALDDPAKQEKLANTLASMEGIYSQATVDIEGQGKLHLEPGLTRLMATSSDYNQLLQVWTGWRDASGKKMRKLYEEFVALSNEAIKANGFADTGAYWKSTYATDTFEQDIEHLYQQLKPFYTNLLIYVRRKLKERYDSKYFPSTGHIPAHLLGNMWAQDWGNLLNLTQPYPDLDSVDVTPAMLQQNYTVPRMFMLSEEFFTSLGLLRMTEKFWNNSMFVRPDDGRDVICHASAWDFYNQDDFRIKMCTDITMSDLIVIHHEMGHIQYFQQYKDQPVPFRDGANPGFHEAIGDVLALSVSTPKHLKKIGLLDSDDETEGAVLNFLLSMALDKIALLPFGYLIDQWRWSVFRGDTKPSNYNDKWWQLRCKYQGVSPPVQRTENDFDPGAKYHIPANTPYIRYFVSTIIQFQFHKALCEAANHTGPLHQCDIYQSEEAGDLLGDVLRMGSSKTWQDAMEVITGQRSMDAGPLLEYFQDLNLFLQDENNKADDTEGWTEACPTFGSSKMTKASLYSVLSLLAGVLVATRTT